MKKTKTKKKVKIKELDARTLALRIIRRQQALLRILATYLNEIDGITENLENLILDSKVTCPEIKEKP